MGANREFKNTVFTEIFNSEENLLELYNGDAEFPNDRTLKLSDSFKAEIDESTKLGFLELEVKVLNINVGHNDSIISKSDTYGKNKHIRALEPTDKEFKLLIGMTKETAHTQNKTEIVNQ